VQKLVRGSAIPHHAETQRNAARGAALILFGDLETFSETPIQHGTYRYAEDSEIMLFPYAVDDGPVRVWDLTEGGAIPGDLEEALLFADKLVYHNSMFDRSVMRLAKNTTPLFRETGEQVERWHDTMAQALAHSLPGGLEKLCEVMKVSQDKQKLSSGKALIQLFCKPRPKNSKLRRATSETHPVEWAQFIEYATYDIHAMRELYRKLPAWNYSGEELALWHLDQRINDRGVCVDLDLAHAALATVDRAQKVLKNTAQEMTAGWLESATKRDKLLEYVLMEHGVQLPDLTKDTIERRINDPDLPQPLRELLAVRLMACTTSTAKYKAVARAVSSDGYLRGLLQFCGAGRTGRWSGRTFQPQNLMRPDMKQYEIDFGIEAIKAGAADLLYENAMRVCANAMRGVIVASKGKKLVIADLANIEGREAAWQAGEEWKLEAFREYDAGAGPDLYKLAYAKAFMVPHEKVNKSQRQIGKVCLSSGTRVLTDSGWKAIETILTSDKLWDGEEWIQHKGLLSQGRKSVLSLAALWLTPDHCVLSGMRWKEASVLKAKSTDHLRALATAAVLLPLPAIWSALWLGLRRLSFVVIAGGLSTLCLRLIFVAVAALGALSADEKQSSKSAGGNTPTPCRKQSTEQDCCKDSLRHGCVVPRRKIERGLTTGGEASACARNGYETAPLFSRTSGRFLGGIILLWRWTARTLTGIMSRVISVLSVRRKTTLTGEKCRSYRRKWTACEKQMQTYDLACAGPRKRFTVLSAAGPLIVHNCELMLQYEGGVGAFITGAASYGIDLDAMAEVALPTIPANVVQEAEGFYEWTIKQGRSTFGLGRETFLACDSLKRLWRMAHPGISSIWGELKAAVTQAIKRPGERTEAFGLRIVRDGAWLKIRLPSGRFLCYPSPQVSDEGQISYMGVNQYSRKWMRINTYGGRCFENVIQASARDVLAHNMALVESHGYRIVLSVHDELITEAPDSPEYNADHLSALMSTVPEWAEGLPLAAAGFESYRYRKE
jgi:hypothetical protein